MNELNQLKEQAHTNRVNDVSDNNQEWATAEGILNGKKVIVWANKVGVNKPGRKPHTRYSFSVEGKGVQNGNILAAINA